MLIVCVALVFSFMGCGKKSTPAGQGSIVIDSNPQGAAVWLDGADTGQVTPASINNVTAATHEISLVLAGYETWTDNVLVTANQTTVVPTVTLTAATPTPTPTPTSSIVPTPTPSGTPQYKFVMYSETSAGNWTPAGWAYIKYDTTAENGTIDPAYAMSNLPSSSGDGTVCAQFVSAAGGTWKSSWFTNFDASWNPLAADFSVFNNANARVHFKFYAPAGQSVQIVCVMGSAAQWTDPLATLTGTGAWIEVDLPFSVWWPSGLGTGAVDFSAVQTPMNLMTRDVADTTFCIDDVYLYVP
ncbi:MAG: PEGA domain-containing protein [Bacillota bacterium]